MKKFVLGNDPATGRYHMSRVGSGAEGARDLRASVLRLPEPSRLRIGEVLAWASSLRSRRLDLVEWVTVYGVSACVMMTSGIAFGLLGLAELNYRLADTERTMLASDSLWYGTLAALALSSALAAFTLVREYRIRHPRR